jgi:hypothetical protein
MKPEYINRREIAQFILKHKKLVLMKMPWCEQAINNQTGAVRMPSAKEIKDSIKKKEVM